MYFQGTQRSILKAQELIDEALSTPDNTLDISTSSPNPLTDGSSGSKVNSSDAKKPHPQTTTVSETSRYMPTNTMTSRNAAGNIASTDYHYRVKPESKTSLPHSVPGLTSLESGLTSVTTTTHTITTATITTSAQKTNPWSRGLDTAGMSVTSVTNSSSQSDSPVHEEVSLGTSTLLSSAPSWDSEEEGKPKRERRDPPASSLNQTTNEIHLPPSALPGGGGISVTPEPGLVDLNDEFPPLSKHGRSQSDPQVSSAERQQQQQQQAQQDSKSSQTGGGVSRLTQSLTSQMAQGGGGSFLKKTSPSSSLMSSVPTIEGSPVSSNEREKLPKSHQSASTSASASSVAAAASGPEKLPFASPGRRNQSDPSVLQSVKTGGVELERTLGSRVGRSGSEDGLVTSKVPSSLAVGGEADSSKVSELVECSSTCAVTDVCIV